jgi:hypothetical protein
MKFSDICQFTDKQWLATETADKFKYTLFGGSRGPGKSYWLRYYLLRRLLMFAAEGKIGVDVMLACEDYPSLTGRQINKINKEFPLWLGSVKSTQDKGLGFHLHPQYGGGSILLRNLDDPSKYQSFEFAIIGIDELTKNPVRTFNILRGSLRWPGVDNTQFVAATNPEANWVRDYWIEKRFPPEMDSLKDQFAFVQALPDDNPHLDKSYWQELSTLSGPLRDAWLFGDWYAGAEGLVYESFSTDNITDQEPNLERSYDIAVDDGYIDPRATLFIQRQANGDILVFDELYETKTLEETTIEHIKTRAAEDGLPLPEKAIVSHEAVALRERITSAGIPAKNWLADKVGGGKSTRLAAITLTRGLILDGNNYRAIKIHRRCINLLDEIRSGYKYPEGKHGTEAHPQDGNDHACNALESWIWVNFGVPTPPPPPFVQGSAKIRQR